MCRLTRRRHGFRTRMRRNGGRHALVPRRLGAAAGAGGASWPPTAPGRGRLELASHADGVVYGLLNHQGGARGGTEFVVPNWWMGMLMRGQDRHEFGLNAMLSLDPATVGQDGYRELFQVGESLDGRPLVDRQHPHDLLMQLSASWRGTFGGATSLVVAGGPAGEPTLGPVAFMHRASAVGLPLAPLGHHTFDSTHISFGVVTAAVEHGRWTIEGSLFNGREPDEHRWDLDLGPMDSVAGRVWFRPSGDGWCSCQPACSVNLRISCQATHIAVRRRSPGGRRNRAFAPSPRVTASPRRTTRASRAPSRSTRARTPRTVCRDASKSSRWSPGS